MLKKNGDMIVIPCALLLTDLAGAGTLAASNIMTPLLNIHHIVKRLLIANQIFFGS